MPIYCFGLSHQCAPIPVVEKLAFSPGQMADFLRSLTRLPAIEEVIGISTCNRTEFYVVSPDQQAVRHALLEQLAALRPELPVDVIGGGAYLYADGEASAHLFRVAGGVDSLIVGEAQILGQIRRAYDQALELHTAGELLHTLLMRAINFGRRVRIETDIGRGNVSVASISVRIAREVAGDLSKSKLLILGAGETAQLAGRHFQSEGVAELYVLNRSRDNARQMARELGGKDIPIDHLQSALEMADVVVCAVGAPHYIITREGSQQIMEARAGRPLLMIDLSMPRNIDPEAGTVPGISLYAIEDLESIAQENRRARAEEISKVQVLAEKESIKFAHWTATSAQNKVVVRMRRRLEEVRRRRMERYAAHLGEAEREQLDLLTDSVLRAVLHDATNYIRAINPDTEQGGLELDMVHRLFNLDALQPEAEELPPRTIADSAG